MKKLLKIFVIVLIALTMLIALAGCQNKEVAPISNTTSNEEINNNSKKEFSMGEWNDDATVYTNEFLGLTLNLPEGWSHLNEEEIAQMMNIAKEVIDDDKEFAYNVSQLTSAYYLVANDINTGNSIALMSEKPIMEFSMDYYINQLKTNLEAIEAVSYEISEISTQTVAGKECTTLMAKTQNSGVIQKYFIYKEGKYFVTMLITSITGEETLDEMIGYFK